MRSGVLLTNTITNSKTIGVSAFCYRLFLITLASLAFLCFDVSAQKIPKRAIRNLFEGSAINNDHHTGFVLYDQQSKKTIYSYNSDKYFTPASNTKLYTFYAALNMLGDSIPGLRYINKGDSLIFWGTGDPSFLHTALKSTRAYEFLKSSGKQLFYSSGNYKGDFYGRGWPYGDFDAYYQAEINALPVEDNVAVISAGPDGNLVIKPSWFQPYLKKDTSYHPARFQVERSLFANQFRYPAMAVPAGYRQEIPWKTSDSVTIALLQDTLHTTVGLLHEKMPQSAKVLLSIPSDTVYRRLLWPSDNFVAEQLLLVCASTISEELNTQVVIDYVKKNFMSDLPHEPAWVDGSGLSRQNLFTPASMIVLLQKIYDKVGDEERLHGMLPAGGVSGTLRAAYKTDNGEPFVWAKTGTLSNVHNQSGFLITRKGRKLIYSYMNNNYTRPTPEIRAEMVRVMTEIHNRY